ncbi:MAG: lamin tail domain-containing protein [Bacteroidota bacterium]
MYAFNNRQVSMPANRQRNAFSRWILMGMAIASIVFYSSQSLYAQSQTIGEGMSGSTLVNHVQQNYTPHSTMGYDVARDTMYALIDANAQGELTGVYTGYTITLDPNADPSYDAYLKGINAEHTWPQSMGAGNEPAKSDMHNLFPAKSNVNSARSNDPFGEIDDTQTDTWYYLDTQTSSIPTSNIDLYSENLGSTAFEPREDHKGNVARAIFYFYSIYQNEADDNFFNGMKEVLYEWHYQDPVDAAELNRSSQIAHYQGNENPFVLDSTLMRRAYFPNRGEGSGGGGSDTTPPVFSSVQATNISSSSVTITWSTDEPADSRVDFGTTTSYGQFVTDGNMVTSHSMTLNNLTAETTYHYRVTSVDGSGNSGSSTDYTFTTTAAGSGGTGDGVIISEVFYDTPGTDADEEWIELYNGTGSTVDLSGYTIIDNNGTGSSFTFPAGTSIAANSYLTLAQTSAGFTAIYGYEADVYGGMPFLNNGGDTILLEDASGSVIDAVAWEGGASAGIPAGWGSTSNPVANTGETIVRSDVTTDTDSYTDWAVATNNGNPQTQDAAVPNEAPVAVANGPYEGLTGKAITFSSSGSSDSDGSIVSFAWDFGDGSSGSGSSPSHTYTTAGSYTVTLTVTDDDGAQATDQAAVTITDPAAGAVVISEVFYDTPGNESKEEWIELYNGTDQALSLSGWTLVDNNGTGQTFTFANKHKMDPHTFLTIAVDRKGFRNLYGYQADDYGNLPPLNNGGDALVLYDEQGQEVDAMAWEGGASAGVPSGWGSTSDPYATEGITVVREDVTVDTDSYLDWTYATNLGNPQTQADGAVLASAGGPGNGADEQVQIQTQEELPADIELGNYPNPFNPSTVIRFSVPAQNQVRLTVYNMLGQQVALLVDRAMPAGYHQAKFDAGRLSSGIYLYRLQIGSQIKTGKMLLTK